MINVNFSFEKIELNYLNHLKLTPNWNYFKTHYLFFLFIISLKFYTFQTA